MENVNAQFDHVVTVNGGIIEHDNMSIKFLEYFFYKMYRNHQMTESNFIF